MDIDKHRWSETWSSGREADFLHWDTLTNPLSFYVHVQSDMILTSLHYLVRQPLSSKPSGVGGGGLAGGWTRGTRGRTLVPHKSLTAALNTMRRFTTGILASRRSINMDTIRSVGSLSVEVQTGS